VHELEQTAIQVSTLYLVSISGIGAGCVWRKSTVNIQNNSHVSCNITLSETDLAQ